VALSISDMLRAHSDVLLLVHVVFATRDRRPLLRPHIDDWLHDQLRRAAPDAVDLLGLGNAADHVHVIASVHPSLSVAELVGRLKGATAHPWNQVHPSTLRFAWQRGYWARSIDVSVLPRLSEYVRDQRRRHAARAVDPLFEQNEPSVVSGSERNHEPADEGR
jgi:putative transposase